MPKQTTKIKEGQKTIFGEKAETTLVRGRPYLPPEEYAELNDEAISRNPFKSGEYIQSSP